MPTEKELASLQEKAKREGRIFYSAVPLVIAVATTWIVLNSPTAKWQAWILIGILALFGLCVAFGFIQLLPPRKWSDTMRKIDVMKGRLDEIGKKYDHV